jgi:prepilin-type N-terminal cleavage/methylation domain-containing protein
MDDMKINKAAQTGFTLTELLVTIAIIGILSGLLLTVLAGAKKKAYRIGCVNNRALSAKEVKNLYDFEKVGE